MTIEEKMDFIEDRLQELKAPRYVYSYIYTSIEILNKIYQLLLKKNCTLELIYSNLGIKNYEEVQDYSTSTGPKLFVKRIMLNPELKSHEEYPFCIPAIHNFESLELQKNVTFLVGENGVGKSTWIEALAVKLELNAAGGTTNFMFSPKDTHSNLYQYLHLVTDISKPKMKFFFRAETFYDFATEVEKLELYSYGNLHACSHGEAFLQLIESKFKEKGLYILDEPEAALSPMSQMKLLCIIHQLAMQGSQFIIATHSPILISYREAEILDLNQDFKRVSYKETQIYRLYHKFLLDSETMQEYLFDEK